MSSIVELAIKESVIPDYGHYFRRVRWLALIYVGLEVVCLIGIGVLLRNGRLYVALAQRSNVETLTLAFFLLLYSYVAVLSFPGVVGAFKIAYCSLAKGAEREARKVSLLKKSLNTNTVALNRVLELQDRPGESIEIPVRDEYGAVGVLQIDGARLNHKDIFADGSNSLFAFLIQEIERIVKRRGLEADLNIVEWKKIDDEETDKYLAFVAFARNLEREIQSTWLWPKLVLLEREVVELERALSQLCPVLREEAMLPDWEYQGEHKIPIIPEPLGIISFTRSEKRVDPLASMGSALIVLSLTLALLLFILFAPPWVPGT